MSRNIKQFAFVAKLAALGPRTSLKLRFGIPLAIEEPSVPL